MFSRSIQRFGFKLYFRIDYVVRLQTRPRKKLLINKNYQFTKFPENPDFTMQPSKTV